MAKETRALYIIEEFFSENRGWVFRSGYEKRKDASMDLKINPDIARYDPSFFRIRKFIPEEKKK